MATVGDTPLAATAPQRAEGAARPGAVSSSVMSCVAVSHSIARRKAWRGAARKQAWEALICRDATQLLQVVRTHRAALIVIDLPRDVGSTPYQRLTAATAEVRGHCQALLAVCGRSPSSREEVWARSQGAWTYLNDLDQPVGMEMLLREARIAIEQSSCVEQPSHAGPPRQSDSRSGS